MPAILCDHDVEGHLNVLLTFWRSTEWLELWEMLNCPIHTFRGLGLQTDTTDLELWQLCQSEQFLLLTGNRNADGDHSLEVTSRRLNRPDSLPVITIADEKRVMLDRQYAERVASQILEILYDVESLRGSRRLFVP
jgi:hypothetical protein